MATPIPVPNHIIIWLDKHIGQEEWNKQLKTGISEQSDPKKALPASPLEPNIEDLVKFSINMEQSFNQIPKHLKAFSNKDDCLICIDENLKNNKKIFFITSGTMGKDIAPDIIEKYSSLDTIYVFCGNIKAHLSWAYDCLEADISCIPYDFHTDLLVRILQDTAGYFTSEGNKELEKSDQLAYSAISYFTWAKSLLHRANDFALVKLFDQLKYVEERIEFTEKLIKRLNGDEDDEMCTEPS